VKRRATVAAKILRHTLYAQPVTARWALRVQTLHSPTGQILHPIASQKVWAGGKESAAEHVQQKRPKTSEIVRRAV
jgi:hypothetical protein